MADPVDNESDSVSKDSYSSSSSGDSSSVSSGTGETDEKTDAMQQDLVVNVTPIAVVAAVATNATT